MGLTGLRLTAATWSVHGQSGGVLIDSVVKFLSGRFRLADVCAGFVKWASLPGFVTAIHSPQNLPLLR